MKTITSALLALAFCLSALSAGASTGDALLKEIDRNLEPVSYESYRKLINIEPSGKRKEFTLFTVKKGKDKMLMLFLEPAPGRRSPGR